MKLTRPLCLYLLGAAIMLAGLFAAVAIYQTASDADSDVLRYEIIDGTAYAVLAGDVKSYRSDLERFGGKAAVFADDFNRWFASLWLGKSLAYTVGALSCGLGLLFLRAAHQSSRKSDARTSGRDDGSS